MNILQTFFRFDLQLHDASVLLYTSDWIIFHTLQDVHIFGVLWQSKQQITLTYLRSETRFMSRVLFFIRQ